MHIIPEIINSQFINMRYVLEYNFIPVKSVIQRISPKSNSGIQPPLHKTLNEFEQGHGLVFAPVNFVEMAAE